MTDGTDLQAMDDSIVPGSYWRVREAERLTRLEVGDLVLVTGLRDGSVWFAALDRHMGLDPDTFRRVMEPAPNGASERQSEITNLMREVNEAQIESVAIEGELGAINPHVDEDGELGETGTDLVASRGAASVDLAKRRIADVRNQIARSRKTMLQKQARLHGILAEQKALIEAKSKQWEVMLKRAEEAIWTVNLYLGKNETIVRLASGEPAAADVPITIRQLVLYMDEESMIAADEGGIDVRNLEDFDEWLLADPVHLAQVLPEEKGVVALKVRRTERDYGDPYYTATMNEANRHTYWLMRNGENLYRIDTDLEVAGTTLPRENEFDEMFWETSWEEGRRVRRPARAGSRTYMDAMQKADARRRHYMRIALFMQGLIDRTKVFWPLPTNERINLLDLDSQAKHLRLIFDAEGEKILGTGRPEFRDWQAEINARLDVGQRIVGAFGTFGSGFDADERRERLHPTNAADPNSKLLHTIERRDGDALVILYERTEQIWDDWEGVRRPKNRASCKLWPTDRFILAFDQASVADMEYYIQSRISRKSYMTMIPVLKRALRLKREEAETEAPFRQMLVGEIMKEHDADQADAERAVSDLVHWWKFKNRTHRALTSDDSKAIRMITGEYPRWAKQQEVREELDPSALIETVLHQHADAILIAHAKGPRYRVLVPEGDDNIFVREQEWTTHGTTRMLWEKRWRTVDGRRMRWEPVYRGDRWEDWNTDARAQQYLTGPERDDLVAYALKHVPEAAERYRKWHTSHNASEPVDRPIAITLGEDHTAKLFLYEKPAWIPEGGLLTDRPQGSDLMLIEVRWSRSRDGIEFAMGSTSHLTYGRYWEPEHNRHNHAGKGEVQLLWFDRDAEAAMETDRARLGLAERKREALEKIVEAASTEVRSVWRDALEREAFNTFMEDYNDADLWEDEKTNRRLRFDPPYTHGFGRACRVLIDAGERLAGSTVGEVLERATELGWSFETESGFGRAPDADLEGLPMDLVLDIRETEDAAWAEIETIEGGGG